MNISFKEKVVVVTGATGLIGGAMAKAFSEHGAFVAVCDLNKEKCDAKAKELGNNAKGFVMDQRSQESVDNAFKAIFEAYGRIDVLMNNAGVNIPQDARRVIRDFFDDKFEWMIDVDLHGMFRCTKAVLPYMIEQKSGCIINTSSVNSTVSPLCWTATCLDRGRITALVNCFLHFTCSFTVSSAEKLIKEARSV